MGAAGAARKEYRALDAPAFFAGLRLGELRALRWRDVDLGSGRLHVERAMDGTGVTITPKSRAGERVVPILTGELRDMLSEHKAASRDARSTASARPSARRAHCAARSNPNRAAR